MLGGGESSAFFQPSNLAVVDNLSDLTRCVATGYIDSTLLVRCVQCAH